MGHGPRGLQLRTGTPGTTSPTIRPGRGRTGGARTGWPGSPTRSSGSALRSALWNGAGPDHQREAVRARQFRGQPRGGRQGVLLLPRLHAHALLHEVALQVSAAGLPLRRPRGHERPPLEAGTGVRTPRHRDLRGRPLLRRLRRVRQGRVGGHPHSGHGREPGAGSWRRCTSCPRSGSATPGAGPTETRPASRRLRAGGGAEGNEGGRRLAPGTRRPLALLRGRRAAALHRERDEQRAGVRHDERRPVRQGRHQRLSSSTARQDAVNPDGVGTKVAADHVVTVAAGGTAVLRLRLTDSRPGAAPAADVFAGFDEILEQRRGEADEFYRGHHPRFGRPKTKPG